MENEMKFRAWEPLNKKMYYMNMALYLRDKDNRKQFALPPSHQGLHASYTSMNLDALNIMQYTGRKDKDCNEIYVGDICELVLSTGEIRRFEVKIKTVNRKMISHPNFDDEIAEVAVTGVVFCWNEYDLFPCVKSDGKDDTCEMKIIGNIYENPELLNLHMA